MVHTAIIAFILILIMFFFTSGDKKEDTEVSNKSNQEVNLDMHDENKELVLLQEVDQKVNIDKVAAEMKAAAEAKAAAQVKATVLDKEEKSNIDVPAVNLLQAQTPLDKKNLEEMEANSKVLDKLHDEENLKETVIAHNEELTKQLEKVRIMAENGEVEARKYEDRRNQEIQSLLGEKKELTSNLSNALEGKKEVEAKTVDLEGRIAKLLAIAKDASFKIKVEYDKDQAELKQLLSEQKIIADSFNIQSMDNKVLEEKTVDLKGRIEKLLAIAKDATEKIGLQKKNDQGELQKLLEEKKTVEASFHKQSTDNKALESKNVDLEAKIVSLLNIAKEGTIKAQASATQKAKELESLLKEKTNLSAVKVNLEAKIEKLLEIAKKGTQKAEVEFASLLSQKESLANNLATHSQGEQDLEVENGKIAQLLLMAKESYAKSKNEIEVKTNEFTALMSQKDELSAEKSNLQSKIDKLLEIAQEGTQKAQLAFNSILSQEKALETENVALKATIEEIKELNKANAEIEKLKEEKRILEESVAETKAKEDAELAAAQAKAQEEADKAAAEAKAQEEADKAAAEAKAKAQEEADKAAAEAKAQEEADKAAAEAKAQEEADKAAAEAKAQEEADIAAAEAKAQEEADIAAAEAKAQEEADIAAAEAKAQEEADKAAAEAKVQEEADKAAAEAKAQEEADKAAAEAKAQEEADKAAADAKAKEEADKAAADAKAKEEADKAAADAKAKEAEVKLMNAFSLTKVAFRIGSMQLTKASKQRLDVAIDTMKNYDGYTYKVQGHTDSRGGEALNLKLSTKRAESVKAYLISKGIDESILSSEGFGSSQPIASNNTKKGRTENRRVVFEIIQ